MSLPQLRITGGPHSQTTRLYLDGVEQKGIVKFLVSGKVNEPVTLYTKQYVSLDIDMAIDTHTFDIGGEPESAVYAALNAVKGKTCSCGHPAHPGLVCGWPMKDRDGNPTLEACVCEG